MENRVETARFRRTFWRVMTITRRSLIAGALSLGVLAAVLAVPGLLGDEVRDAVTSLAGASPGWLWLAALAFAASCACTGGAWRAGVRSCGGQVDLGDAAARYGAGSLVNSFAPAGSGGCVRVALFSRCLEGTDRIWTAGGIAAAVAAARALALAVLVLTAAVSGAVPLWPVFVLAGVGGVAIVAAAFAARRRPSARLAHVLDVFRALGTSSTARGALMRWTAAAAVTRLAAAASIAAAVGISDPLSAALVIVPAVAVACVLPLTPGNVGVASAAAAVALQATGVDLTTALAAGIAFHAVETLTGIAFGLASTLVLAQSRSVVPLRLAGAGACVVVAAGFGATVVMPLL
jgi:uncharacterized membrane protein YbhN (UPF0104 family)